MVFIFELSNFICSPVDGVLGFTRETVIALTTNIESREWKRREYANLGHVQEHQVQMMWNVQYHERPGWQTLYRSYSQLQLEESMP